MYTHFIKQHSIYSKHSLLAGCLCLYIDLVAFIHRNPALLFTSGRIFTLFESVFCVNVPQLRAADDRPQIARTTEISVLAALKLANENVLNAHLCAHISDTSEPKHERV